MTLARLEEPDVEEAGFRSRLLQADAERERLERVLLMLPKASEELSMESLVETLANACCELTGARTAIALLPDHLSAPVVAGVDSRSLAKPLLISPAPIFAPAFDGNLVYVDDATRVELADIGAFSDGRSVRSIVVIPIVGRRHRRPIGVLALLHHRARAFSERRVSLAGSIAAQLGYSVETTDFVAEQSRISNALQQSLLPPLMPSVPGLEVSACYRPSGSGNLVGGDFYDVFPDGAGGWDLLLGDASGIGPEAAGLAGIARYMARALAESALAPGAMLEHVNRALLRSTTGGRFCTAVIARFAVRAGSADVEIASAGHPPALLLRSDGTTIPSVTSTGMVLGVLDDAPVGVAELSLGPGDALVFYTDGVSEARDAKGDFFGEDGIAAVLRDSAGRSAEGISRRLDRAVLDHRGSRNSDDVAILVVRHPAA